MENLPVKLEKTGNSRYKFHRQILLFRKKSAKRTEEILEEEDDDESGNHYEDYEREE